jgi:hypothetical protein
MATRSCIGIKHGDRIKAIYSHWDGYLEHHGRILQAFYSNSVDVNKLIATGDISSLGATVGEKIDFGHRWADDEYINVSADCYAAPQCIFYSRDRGEDASFKSFGSEAEFVDYYDGSGAEFYYLFDNGVWYVKSYNSAFKPLHEELARLDKELA